MDPTDRKPVPTSNFIRSVMAAYFREAATNIVASDARRRIGPRSYVVLRLPEVLRGRVPMDVENAKQLNEVSLLIDEDVGARAIELMRTDQNLESERMLRLIHTPEQESENLFIDRDGIGISMSDSVFSD